MTILETIKSLLSEIVTVEVSETITESTHFANDLNIDSLDVVEFTMALEERYDIAIEDEEAKSLHTVGDVITYLRDKHGVE